MRVRTFASAGQRSFDELGTPLSQVTFCVLDLETTGGSAHNCGITEIGAVRVRGGEVQGTFQTLINPGVAVPPSITVLTGITSAMVVRAPPVGEVLPAFLEFAGGSVLVGHNVRFDLSFLDAALTQANRAPLAHTRVDTCALARRLVRDEVPDCRLGTLASRLRLDHQPSHRALDDALATTDLLHYLLERAASLGVLGLEDLLELPSMGAHPQAGKLKLTVDLPRSPGVYAFRDRGRRLLYVGKATNLRSRVRSYFSTDDRRSTGSLLRETVHIEHLECSSPLEAAVYEARLLGRLRPRYNKVGTRWGRAAYLRLTEESFPRLSVARSPGGSTCLGPLPSAAVAKLVADALHSATDLRRCTAPARPGRVLREGACAAAQLGVAQCPCTGTVTEAAYRPAVELVRRGLSAEPDLLLGPLADRMSALADAQRFEEAAELRQRADALSSALRRQRRVDQLRMAGRVRLAFAGGGWAELDGGLLHSAGTAGQLSLTILRAPTDLQPALGVPEDPDPLRPPSPEVAAELQIVASYLDQTGPAVALEWVEGMLASPLPALRSFTPRRR